MYAAIAKKLGSKAARKKTFNDLKTKFRDKTKDLNLGKALAIVVLVLLIVWGLRKVFGSLKSPLQSLISKLTADINKIKVDKSNLTHSNSEFSSFASTLEAAMNYTGTDEEAVFSVLREMNTQDDWNQMIKTFGIRKKINSALESDDLGDLKFWITDELSSSDRDYGRSILSSKNIKF